MSWQRAITKLDIVPCLHRNLNTLGSLDSFLVIDGVV